jgi:hypothetical protein
MEGFFVLHVTCCLYARQFDMPDCSTDCLTNCCRSSDAHAKGEWDCAATLGENWRGAGKRERLASMIGEKILLKVTGAAGESGRQRGGQKIRLD